MYLCIYVKQEKAIHTFIESSFKLRRLPEFMKPEKEIYSSLLTVIFIKLFTIENRYCNLPPTTRVKEVLNQIPNITVREMKNCIAKAKCSWCYLSHSLCSFDPIKKDWKYLPICQETCKSYQNLRPCAKLLLQLNHIIKDLVKYCRHVKSLVALDCTRYPKHKSDNCFYEIPGKHIDLVIMIVLFKRSDYSSCVSIKKE